MGADRWQFWIDRGGTFTDCLGVAPDGQIHTKKVLSGEGSPLVGIRALLGLAAGAPIPACDVRMGTTLATNALLERRGAKTALVISRGFRDLLEIGNQTRPELFALSIRKPELLYSEVLEVDARAAADGTILCEPDPEALGADLRALRRRVDSLAVVVLHSYLSPALEERIGAIAAAAGFSEVALSSEVASELGMLGRGDTAVVDAYLTPLLRDYVAALLRDLPGSTLRIMQSSGGLTDAARFRGKNAVLSGPAAGAVAAAHVAAMSGASGAVGFDMGGTSTDVSAWEGEHEHTYESEIAGVRLRAPMMAIHTVAAGGGSICRDNGFRLLVGPQSAGADPGPLCYGRAGAEALTITDVNLFLGRLVGDRFPFPLERPPVEEALRAIAAGLEARGEFLSLEAVAAGFLEIANAHMAEAIRAVTIARGRDVRDSALVVYGGAGGQHACSLARLLGIRTLILDRHAGVLSAYGMGLARLVWHGEADAGRRELGGSTDDALAAIFMELEARGRAALASDGALGDSIEITRRLDLRYRGTDSPITIAVGGDLRAKFDAAHERLFGYLKEAPIEVVTVRVEVGGNDSERREPITTPEGAREPEARRRQRMWTGRSYEEVSVYDREALSVGTRLRGPALILDDTGTFAVDGDFELEVAADSRIVCRAQRAPRPQEGRRDESLRSDPISLEVYNQLFMSISSQMGDALRRTAVSTNIRERRDYSCAIFDPDGGLVANAPHIPVHLGAMAESIRGLLAARPALEPGSVYATNDPYAGGSHLPDITVVTPCHSEEGKLLFFTASRGHHADVGGITPGSMPPYSRRLAEEGALLSALEIVSAGRFREAEIRELLAAPPHPARRIDDNIADLQAQIAANRAGARLLGELVAARGAPAVAAFMRHVQDGCAAEVAAAIGRLPDGELEFEDALDGGARIRVALRISGERLEIDFRGTSAAVPDNLNAPRAVTVAAVIYVLRCLVAAPIPLNSGCLAPVTLLIPVGSLLDPPAGAAVAAGNVETSQRVVDVLFGALGVAAASQGTMNNLTFGSERFAYYETIAGGAGATASANGASAVHTHMTNTRITDPEVLESRFPVRLREFSIRRGSGGRGARRGGDGVVRELEALEDLDVSILSERRILSPFGLRGGSPGAAGRNLFRGQELGGRAAFRARPGECFRIETPGGGGYGTPPESEE